MYLLRLKRIVCKLLSFLLGGVDPSLLGLSIAKIMTTIELEFW